MSTETFTPPEVARMHRVSHEKVLAWINAGELRAINVATRATGRPQWRITSEALADFELRRSAMPEINPQRRRRRLMEGVKEYF